MGTLVISKKENGKFKYSYNNRKGNTIFTSNAFDSKTQCYSDINIIKRHFELLEFIRFKSGSGKLFFRLKLNSFILGQSRKFTTSLLIEKGIDDFKKNFVLSEVLDFTEDIFETISSAEEATIEKQ